jgi:hypothetical protein
VGGLLEHIRDIDRSKGVVPSCIERTRHTVEYPEPVVGDR